jgi:sporulation protein YlmC with PRC-barrel domain
MYEMYENMSAELRLKKLRGSGGFVMARVTDEQQSKGNLGGPDLFLAPIGRLESKLISKHTCNTCEKEFEGSPKIEFENPNEEVADNLILAERGKYLCNECGSTIAEYRDFRKPNEAINVGLATPMEQQESEPSGFESFSQPETTPPETIQQEITTEVNYSVSGTVRDIVGMDVFDESAKRIGKTTFVGVDDNQKLVLVVSDVSGNEENISWGRVAAVGEVIFLGKCECESEQIIPKVAEAQEVPVGQGLRCTNCNFDNKPDSKFCESCGNQL